MRRTTVWGAIVGVVLVLVAGFGSTAFGQTATANGTTTQGTSSSHINHSEFTGNGKIDNKYFPLKPGTTFVYRGKSEGNAERDLMTVTDSTKRIQGVKCVVVNDRVFVQGKLEEKTFDWYAQDKEGNVWYFGEDSKEYKNGHVVSTEGSWEAGKHGARPGIIMQAHPKVGQTYRQEYEKGVAEDLARVLKLNGSARVPYGSFHHVLVTREWSPLDPGQVEHKYYAAGVGNIKEVAVKGVPETLELVNVKHTG
jgi:hypothetical protein